MSSPRALAVHHLAVLTHDLVRAEEFYAGVLGLDVDRRWQDEGGSPRSVWLRLGGDAFLAVELANASAPTRPSGDPPGWHCVALAIELAEREPFRARLERAGIAVVRETAFTLYVRDPDGNLIGLSHFPVPASAATP
jgi:glyoxylase I family protein